MPEAVIVATARSPIGRANKGSLTTLRPDDMSAQIVRALLDKVPQLDRTEINDLMMGIGQPAGEGGFNIARVTAILAGLDDVPGVTVNRYCSSSLQTIRMAFHAIKAGEGDCFVAAGVETVSRYAAGASDTAPNSIFNEAGERTRARSQGGQGTWTPPAGLPDIYIAMGQTAENVVEAEGVSREEMDRFGVRSHNLACAAIESGFFEREITPLTLPDGTVVAKDDGPRPGTNYEAVSQLKPVFRPDGTITAGNACPLNDGAAAVLVMSDEKAAALGLTPLARIVSSGVSGLNPEIMGLGPIEACRRALALAGMTIDQIDLVEINEAFAAQVIPSAKHLGIDMDKLNVHGGGIALGHPFGMTGARIMTTLINGLQTEDKTYGLESMCVGGGQGMAMIVERLQLITPAVASSGGQRPERVGPDPNDVLVARCRPGVQNVRSPARHHLAEGIAGGVGDAVAERLHHIEGEAGRFCFRLPHAHEPAPQLRLVEKILAGQHQLERRDRDELDPLEVEDVTGELAVEHDDDGTSRSDHAADPAVAHLWQPVVARLRDTDAVAGLQFGHAPPPSSATTASLNAGQWVRAQSPNSRSPSMTQASPTAGSTHRNVPLPPKWPNVADELVVPVQCGCLPSRISGPRPHGLGEKRPTPGRMPPRSANCTRVASAAVSCVTRVGRSISCANRARSSTVLRNPFAGDPVASVAVIPSGTRIAWVT